MVTKRQQQMRGKRVVEVSRVRRVSQKMERVYEVDECGSTSSVDGIPKQMKKRPRRAGLRERYQGRGPGKTLID